MHDTTQITSDSTGLSSDAGIHFLDTLPEPITKPAQPFCLLPSYKQWLDERSGFGFPLEFFDYLVPISCTSASRKKVDQALETTCPQFEVLSNFYCDSSHITDDPAYAQPLMHFKRKYDHDRATALIDENLVPADNFEFWLHSYDEHQHLRLFIVKLMAPVIEEIKRFHAVFEADAENTAIIDRRLFLDCLYLHFSVTRVINLHNDRYYDFLDAAEGIIEELAKGSNSRIKYGWMPSDTDRLFIGLIEHAYIKYIYGQDEGEQMTEEDNDGTKVIQIDDLSVPIYKSRPAVEVTHGDLKRVGVMIRNNLIYTNDPKQLFTIDNKMARLEIDNNGMPYSNILDKSDILFEVTNRLFCYKNKKIPAAAGSDGPDEFERVPERPKPQVIEWVQANPKKDLPVLKRIVTMPYFDKHGVLHTDHGYDDESGVLFYDTGLRVPKIPLFPSAEEISDARDYIIEELFGGRDGGFPFVEQPDVANAVGLFLLPFVRDMIPDSTPIFVIRAPVPRTGKGLLCDCLTMTLTGTPAAKKAYVGEDELEKRITPDLIAMEHYFIVDNVPTGAKFDSGAISSVSMSPMWSGRVLGKSMNVKLPVRFIVILIGNNIQLSEEISKRVVPITLDPNCENPELRPESCFRHPDVRSFTRENRGNLIWSACVLIQNWVAMGKPLSEKTIGGCERCVKILGGILEAAGIEGFIDNLSTFNTESDEESEQRRALVELWFDKYGENPVIASDLLYFANEDVCIPEVIKMKADKEKCAALGRYISRIQNKVVGFYKVKKIPGRHRGGTRYYLEKIDDPERT